MSNKTKVVLITGAARRLGAAMARHLHEAGFNLLVHYRHSKEEAEALCADLNRRRPDSARSLSAELKEIATFPALIEEAVGAWGRLDALVNNASCFYKTPLGTVQEAEWDELLASNLKAPFFLSQAAAPYLAKVQGSIVNITDIHIEKPFRDYGVYCVSKAGLAALTRTLAKEWGPEIRVNAISPGMMFWPEGENVLTPALQEKIVQEAALKRIGHPDELAKAVLFFIRDADYITGQVLAVDGGRLL